MSDDASVSDHIDAVVGATLDEEGGSPELTGRHVLSVEVMRLDVHVKTAIPEVLPRILRIGRHRSIMPQLPSDTGGIMAGCLSGGRGQFMRHSGCGGSRG